MAITRLGPNQSVNLASNVTGTLPTANGGTGATSFAPGKVLQVVQGRTPSADSITAQSFTDTGITANITPSATSSKVLVIITASAKLTSGSSRNSAIGGVNILRDSTQIYGGGNNNSIGLYFANTNNDNIWTMSGYSHLDSPSSTSSLTYKMQAQIETSGETITFQTGAMQSTITLMEIAG